MNCRTGAPDLCRGQMHSHRHGPEDAIAVVQKGKAQLSIEILAKSLLAPTLLIHMYGQPELCPDGEEAGGEDKKTHQVRQGGHSS